MKGKRAIFILLGIILFGFTCFCAQAQGIKIAVVDLQKVLKESEPGKKAIAELSKKFKELRQKLEKEQKKIKKAEEELQRQRLMLSQEARIDKETEYKKMVQNYQIMYKSYQYKMQLEEKRLREPIVKMILKIVDEYRKEKGLDLIIDKNIGVVSSSNRIDITSEIIKRLNKRWAKEHRKK